jgi:thiamine-phosphate pyrophosphorylase
MNHKLFKKYCFISELDKEYIKSLDNKITIIFRNYDTKYNLEKLKLVLSFCHLLGKKIILANNPKIALKLKFDGVYIPAFNKKIYYNLLRSKNNFDVLGSAHNLKEIRLKEKQGVDVIFLSPLFKVYKSKYFLGINRFNNLAKLSQRKIIALGGIDYRNFKVLNFINAQGFASISFFKKTKKNGPKVN